MAWFNDVNTETITGADVLPNMYLLIRDSLERIQLLRVLKVDPMPDGNILWCTNGFHLQCTDDTTLVTVT